VIVSGVVFNDQERRKLGCARISPGRGESVFSVFSGLFFIIFPYLGGQDILKRINRHTIKINNSKEKVILQKYMVIINVKRVIDHSKKVIDHLEKVIDNMMGVIVNPFYLCVDLI
jgi:hypothetical protein